MNLGQATVVLRYRSALEVVDLTLRFVRSVGPVVFVKLGAIVLWPTWLLLLGLHYGLEMEWLGVWLLTLSLMALLELPFAVLAGQLLFDPAPSLKRILQSSVQVLPAFLASHVVYLSLWLASLLLVIGPLFVSGSYCFLTEAVVLERAGPIASLKRARKFLAGRSGTGLETALLRASLLIAFVVVSELLGQAVLSFVLDVHVPVDTLWQEGGSPFALAGALLWLPYGTAFRFLAYANERTRQDGWDIQVAFLNLRARDEHRSQGEEAA